VYTDDSAYRAIERNAERNRADLAVTGADLAAGAERVADYSARVVEELDSLGAAIAGSGLGEQKKGAILHQVAMAQEEAAALQYEVDALRRDAGRLNSQLAEQRGIGATLSAEHDRREAAAAADSEELAATREKLVKVSGQRNLAVVIVIAMVLAILGAIALRVFR
jgi:hypothetical protein